ncbi:MAG: hypothetical protein ABI867_08625 [Kofleriaceae bacterium]
MPAAAERTGGSSGKGGGGSGPLGQVSSGIGAASGAGTPSHPTSGTSSNYVEDAIDRPDCVRTVEGRVVQGRVVDGRLDCPHGYVMITNERNPILGSTVAERSAPSSDVDLYLGAQKVQDSDGSLSVGLAITDYRFRVAGTFSHYFEGESDGSRVTMTLPTLTAGLRIDNFGRTKMILEGGVAYVRTKGDPMANSSITGAIVGVQVEHAVSPKLTIVGLAQHMAFPDKIRAESGLVGVRYGVVQAALRVLDFNVGPALYGPEVGVSF